MSPSTILLFFSLLFALSSFRPVYADTPLPCAHLEEVELTGTISYFGMIQQEPQASPQFHYDLELQQPWCDRTKISFSLNYPLTCLHGNIATVTGNIWPPDSPLSMVLFDLKEVKSCTAPEK